MTSRRALSLLSTAILVSALGDFLAVIPLALRLQHDSGSGLVVAGLFIALWTPVVVLAAPAGLLVDRTDPRRALIAISALQALVAVALAFADSTGAILALTALLGCGVAVANPAEFALVPAIARSDGKLKAANGRIESARYLGYTLGRCSAARWRPEAARASRCSSTPRASPSSRSSPSRSARADAADPRTRTSAARATASSSSSATAFSGSSSRWRSRRCSS